MEHSHGENHSLKKWPAALLLAILALLFVASQSTSAASARSAHGLETNYFATANDSSLRMITPVADATVMLAKPSDNYGSSSTLTLRAGDRAANSFLKFDALGLTGTVQNALLRLWVTKTSSGGGTVYSINDPWAENDITWNDAPAFAGAALDSIESVSKNEWIEFDVTNAISGAGTYSFGLSGSSSNTVQFNSREGANPPQLLITLDSGSPTVPVADFSAGATSGAVPLTVDFDDLSTGSPTIWSWTFGDGNSSSAQNPTHTYTAPGTFTVSLTATNTAGSDSETKTGYIVVNVPDPLLADFSADVTPGAAPLTIDFDDLSTGSPTTWSWDFGDGDNSAEQNPTHTYTESGSYTVSLTVSDGAGSDTLIKTNYIIVDAPPLPSADFSAGAAIGAAPLTVNFVDHSTGSPTTWSWDFGDGDNSAEQNPTHTYTMSGTFTVLLTVSNESGSDTVTRQDFITVTGSPSSQSFSPMADAKVNLATPTENYGSDGTLELRSGNRGWASYLKFDVTGLDGPVQAAVLRLFVTDASNDGGTLFSTTTLWTEEDLNANNAPALNGTGLDAAGSAAKGTWVEFDVSTAVSGNGLYSFGLSSSSGNNVMFSSRESANPPQLEITVDDELPSLPTAEFSAGVTSGFAPLTVNFSDYSSGGQLAWSWDFGDGDFSLEQHPAHTYTTPGDYTVALTVSNSVGTDTVSKANFITVLEMPAPIPQVGVWITDQELAQLPLSGPAWEQLKAAADAPAGTPDLSNQDDPTNIAILAKALVFARTGEAHYRDEVVDALHVITYQNTEEGGRTLALSRELAAYVVAADLIVLGTHDPILDYAFRSKLTELLSKDLKGRTLQSTHEDRPNNWGTHAGASRAAVAVYLGDTAELDRTAQVFKGWLGDRTAYAGFEYGTDLSWQCDPLNPVGINPLGCLKDGHSIDGALPDDMRRGGSFSWPPTPTGYAWEALQGAIVQAHILHRAGYDVWNWQDQALYRAVNFLYNTIDWLPEGDDSWQPWLVNRAYGSTFLATTPAQPGKNMGWTDWTHAAP